MQLVEAIEFDTLSMTFLSCSFQAFPFPASETSLAGDLLLVIPHAKGHANAFPYFVYLQGFPNPVQQNIRNTVINKKTLSNLTINEHM